MTNIQWHIRPELLLENKKILELCETLSLDPDRDFLESVIKTLDTPTPALFFAITDISV